MFNQLMGVLPIPLLLPLVGLIGPVMAVGLVVRNRRIAARYRRAPLSHNLLRPAGYGITIRIAEIRDRGDECIIELILVPVLMLMVYGWYSSMRGEPLSIVMALPFLVVTLAHLVWRTQRLVKITHKLTDLRLALDAEMATGQELDQLMRQGAAVFHDLPAQYGNIDHVVITKAGVFAVETKGRSKPQRGLLDKDHYVHFDGKALRFPTRTEVRPLEQARQQAQWLSRWLSQAVGSKIDVTPVVMLPGWFVTSSGPGTTLVLNPGQKNRLLRVPGRCLDHALLHRIAHAVEGRCRTVQPQSLKSLPIKLSEGIPQE